MQQGMTIGPHSGGLVGRWHHNIMINQPATIACYAALQYGALHTCSQVDNTLSMPCRMEHELSLSLRATIVRVIT